MGIEAQSPKKVKIYFHINKEVKFGEALYVIGNIRQLGSWRVENSLKLSWQNGHVWTGFISVLASLSYQDIEFKYAIANWQNPSSRKIQWEAGKNNRKIQLDRTINPIICQNSWNKQRISLNLLVDTLDFQEYYVIGNCKQLGSWKSSQKLNQITNDTSHNLIQGLNVQKAINSKCMNFTFEVFRAKPNIHYYYIKKSVILEIQRHPGRKYELQKVKNFHPRCLQVKHQLGGIQIFEICNFNELTYSKINQNIYLGAYIRDEVDLKLLKKEGITSIMSIQTESDFLSHSLTSNYIEKLCEDFDISYYSSAIEDMNKKDFIQKCSGPLIVMKQLIKKKHEKIYIHCSAGVYRSSQLVVLYLILSDNLEIDEAINLVKEKHPVARPNTKIVKDALLKIGNIQKFIKSSSFS